MLEASSNLKSSEFNDAEERFHALADFAPVMIWMSRRDKLCDWFNKSWLTFTGRTLEQEWGNGWTEGVHRDDIEQYLEIYTKYFDARESFSVDYRLRRHDGAYRWILVNGAPQFDCNGTFNGFIGSCIDIHERKLYELELADKSESLNDEKKVIQNYSDTQKQLYETILSATPDFIYIFEFSEPEHRFAYANEGLLKMFGRTYEETVGKTFSEIGYEPWHAEMHNKEIDTVRVTKKPLQGEVPFHGTYGKRIYDYIFAPVFDNNGEVKAVAGITRDVTERHNTEEVLKHNEELLQAADQRKDEFLAMLAHELRNPLAPINAATQIMILSKYDEPQVRNSCQIIERQVKHMVGLVDDLLDVSRVTRGLVEIDKSPQNIKTVISNSIEQVKPLIESKKHQFTLDLAEGHISVLGDHKRLVQIISNVLNNAAKYTQQEGKINIAMNVSGNVVIITITDNGVGISQEDQQNIFELFSQAKRSSDRTEGGLGIGLALVKSILKLHNGDISCKSSGRGQGSQFTITLPVLNEQVVPEPFNSHVEFEKQKMLSILVVDDNIDAAETMASLLELFGHKAHLSNDSLEALELVNVIVPDICILDIGLPKIDGYELARRIRLLPNMAHTTLIAVTGYGQDGDVQMALKSGFDYHLVKPIDLEVFTDIIGRIAMKKI